MKFSDILLLLIPVSLILFITLLLVFYREPTVIVKKEVVPMYYRYSHYPNYWDVPRVQTWPVLYSYPFNYSPYPVGGYSGGYSGGIRTGGSHHGGHGGGYGGHK